MSVVEPRPFELPETIVRHPVIRLREITARALANPDTPLYYYASYQDQFFVVLAFVDDDGVPRIAYVAEQEGKHWGRRGRIIGFAYREEDASKPRYNPTVSFNKYYDIPTVLAPPGITESRPIGYSDADYARAISPLRLSRLARDHSPPRVRASTFRTRKRFRRTHRNKSRA
jgi:hypothetical protein